mgnify:FL=1
MRPGKTSLWIMVGCLALCPASAQAMHISEGILPPSWAGLWFAVAIPAVLWGLRDIRLRGAREPRFKTLVGLVGAAVFLISCMPVPIPVVGTCSHPCGTGLAAILIGPGPTVVVASIALLFQALFLAHGGLTTLGGNILSMGVGGAFSGYLAFLAVRKATGSTAWAAFAAGLLSDWVTYAVTATELSLALAGDGAGQGMFLAILAAFAPTQVPLGVAEGFLSMAAYGFLCKRRPGLVAA